MKNLNKISKIIKKIEKELKIWKDLRQYVHKHMRGKTNLTGLDKEINYILTERKNYLNALKKNEKD